MADQHNSNIPAIGNTIAADIPDIKENLEFHKDAFQRIFAVWSDSDNSGAKFSTTPGFNDGTYNITFPTQPAAGLAHAKIMTGTSDTITWFYLNSAPPGWKIVSTPGDTVLAVAGGTKYPTGGTSTGSWEVSGLTNASHTHTGPSHTHTGTTATGLNWASGRVAGDAGGAVDIQHDHTITTAAGGTGNTGAATPAISSDSSWRPAAHVGKLFQLDTA
jgi:hypothetical protein